MVWVPDGEKSDDVFSRFDTISVCARQTDILRPHGSRYAWYHAVIKNGTCGSLLHVSLSRSSDVALMVKW